MQQSKTTRIEFDELGPEYQRRFFERARYLLDRGYMEGDYRMIARKMYDAHMREKEREFYDGKDSPDS